MHTETNTPLKGAQLSSCCVPVCALRLNEGIICICFIHNHTAYLKSMNSCPQFSVHLQIFLLWLMAVQFTSDCVRRVYKHWCQSSAFFNTQPTEKVDFGLKKNIYWTVNYASVFGREFDTFYFVWKVWSLAFTMCLLESRFSCVCCRLGLDSLHTVIPSFFSVPSLCCSSYF